MVREALYDTVIGAGLACMDEVLEMERVALCGERYEHWADSQALRAGRVASSLVMGRRRVALQRPRAPTVDGHELARENQRKAGVQNVEFLKGEIENIPLPDSSVDVIISNCVMNLSADKDRVLAEYRSECSGPAVDSPCQTSLCAVSFQATSAAGSNCGRGASPVR